MIESKSAIVSQDKEIKRQKRLAAYRKYYAGHKEKARAYYQANKGRFAERCNKWRSENPERYRENQRRGYAKDPARRIAATMKHQKSHRAERMAYMEKWRTENKDHIKEYDRRKRQTPEGRIAAIQAAHKRTALKNRCAVRATKTTLKRFMETAKQCHYCGTTKARMTIDHFVPLARGGAHSLENIVPACKSCNSRKRDRDPYEFIRSIGRLL